MKSRKVHTDRAPEAIGPYSQGIRAGEWLFVSGQLGLVPETGALVGAGFAPQSRQALRNLREILLAEGCQLADVVTVDVYLTDLCHFADFNGIYGEFFGQHQPARAVVEVNRLPKGAAIEIKCVALRGSG